MSKIKVSEEQALLINMAVGAAIDAGIKYFTAYYDRILDASEEESKTIAAELKASRQEGLDTIINL